MNDQEAQPNEQPMTVVTQKGTSSLHSSCLSDRGKRYTRNNTQKATASVTAKSAITAASVSVRICNCAGSGLLKALEHRDAMDPMDTQVLLRNATRITRMRMGSNCGEWRVTGF